MDFDPDCCDKFALELIGVHEKGHRLDSHGVTSSARHCKDRSILDHIRMTVGIRKINLKTRVIYLNKRWQGDLIVTLLGLVEAESVIYGRHNRDNLEICIHRCRVVV